MHRPISYVAAAVSAGVIMLAAAPAWTCLQPTAEFQLDELEVPSNVQGAMYRNCENVEPDNAEEAFDFALIEEDSGDEIEVSYEHERHGLFEIYFEGELEDETTYRFEADPECADHGSPQPAEWTFETTTEEEFPEVIGHWVPSDEVVAPIRFADYVDPERCTVEAMASQADFNFEPSEEVEPWGEALALETLINTDHWEPQLGIGETVPAGSSRIGWGEERVYSVCGDEQPMSRPYAETLTDRGNRVDFNARLPGTDKFWSTTFEGDHEYVFFSCPEDEDENGDENGDDNGDDDNGDDENGGDDGDDDGAVDVIDDDAACAQPGATTPAALLVTFLLLVLIPVRRRCEAT